MLQNNIGYIAKCLMTGILLLCCVATNANSLSHLTANTAFNKAETYQTISREQAIKDLQQLEETIRHRHSYIHSVNFDYVKAIDYLKSQLPEQIPVPQLALQIHKLVQLIGDNHAMVTGWQNYLVQGYSPIKFAYLGNRFFGYFPSRSGYIDKETPFITHIDNIEIERWYEVAANLTSGVGASESTKKGRSLQLLEHINHIRTELNLPIKSNVTFSLLSEDGKQSQIKTLSLSPDLKDIGKPFKLSKESKVLPDNIGYLRIYSQRNDELLNSIDPLMKQFKDTKALIIDARQCGGGRRHNLRALFPYFMNESDGSYIANLAKYRIPNSQKDFDPIGKLGVENKNLRHVTNPIVTNQEKTAFNQLMKDFKPSWQPKYGDFTDWYFMPLKAEVDKYHYSNPVYLLIDWGVGSAGDIFTSAFKSWRDVTLVGSATNGRSGQSRNFVLNFSQIPVKLSTMASFQRTGKKYDWVGIQPDVYMEAEMSDWLGQSDSQLDKVIKLIHEQ